MGPKEGGRRGLQTEAQELPGDLDESRSGNFAASKKDDCLSLDTEHSSMSVFIPLESMPQEFPQSTKTQHRLITANRSAAPWTASEEKQSADEQRIDDLMSPLSPCTETSAQNTSPARSTIGLQAGSITVSRARHMSFY